MRDRGDLIYSSGSNYSRRNKSYIHGKHSYKKYPEYYLYTESNLKTLIDAQIYLQTEISILEEKTAVVQKTIDLYSIMQISSLERQLAKTNAEIKAIEAFKNHGSLRVSKVMHKTVCSDCCAETQVPFKPDPKKPVYCRKCLPKHRKPRERG